MDRPSTFKNMVLALVLICTVCAALLGGIYSLTEQKIAQTKAAKAKAAIAAVLPEFDNDPSDNAARVGAGEIYTATRDSVTIGYAVKVKTTGFGGAITMMVGFLPDGTIYDTDIIEHSETPGLGAKITDGQCNPRVQVCGHNPSLSNLTVAKDGGDIDGITASTITSRAFLKGIASAYDVFAEFTGAQPHNTTEANER